MRQTLPEIYEARVAAGTLRADPAQRALLPALEDLRLWLEAQGERRAPGLLSIFRRAPDTPPGIYIWGGVGRGKSLMMDAFFKVSRHRRKRRVHFHEFMREIHTRMRGLSGQEDPLDVISTD